MRPFWMHVGHGFAKIDAIISRFGACGARVAHRSPADVVAQTKGGAAVTTLACLNIIYYKNKYYIILHCLFY